MTEGFAYKYRGNVYRVPDNSCVTASEIDEFVLVMHKCFETIKKSSEIRNVILETWILVEYVIRLYLCNIYSVERFKTDELDPKYELLSSSYEVCLQKLELLLKSQRKLPDPPAPIEGFHPSRGILRYLQNHPEIKELIIEIENECNKSYDKYRQSELLSVKPLYFGPYKDIKLMALLKNIDDEWFKRARKLNKIRNFAAHSFDENKIYGELGLNGKNRLTSAREYCLEIIRILCGYEQLDSDAHFDIDMDG